MDCLLTGQSVVVQNQTKINTWEIFEKYNITFKCKAQLHIVSFYKMVPMPIIRPTLKIDILKMEQAFHMGYKEGDKVFYLFPKNWKGVRRKLLFYNRLHGMSISLELENEWFEKLLQDDQDLVCSSNKMFFIWDKNHHIQAWSMP
jgi:hypothetical protein